MIKPRRATLLWLVSLFAAGVAHANYSTFELDTSTATHKPILEDVNGDGRADLIVPRFDRSNGRELHIHHQTADNSFETTPQRIDVKSDMVAFAIADIRADAGNELILITPTALFSLSANIDGFVGNVRHLYDWKLLIRNPDPTELLYLPTSDINGDGRLDVVLPGEEKYGVFLNEGGDRLVQSAEISLVKPRKNVERFIRSSNVEVDGVAIDERGFSISSELTSLSQYAFWITPWVEDDNTQPVAGTERWLQGFEFASFNQDQRKDFYQLVENDLVIHLQKKDASYADPFIAAETATKADEPNDLDQPDEGIGTLQLVDFDGDGDSDIVETRNRFRAITLRLFRNDGKKPNLKFPTQVLKIRGMDAMPSFIRLDPHQKPLLALNVFSIPLAKMLRDVQIHRRLLLFAPASNSEKVFSESPLSTWREEFRAESVANLLPNSLEFDVDNDGRPDLLNVSPNGLLAARRITRELMVESEVFWEYMPERSIQSFRVMDLNGDKHPDLALEHSNAMLYLIHDQQSQ